jgi:FKBP-type peptidyl-prolyl cis-trans isomerase (trigger factor)
MAVEIKKLQNSNVEFVITLEGAEVKTMRTKVLGSIAREVCNYQRIRPVYIRVYRK